MQTLSSNQRLEICKPNLTSNRPCKVSTSTINEELGEVEYVFTDKTGTLTQNQMELKGICIADKVFGGRFVRETPKTIRFVDNSTAEDNQSGNIIAPTLYNSEFDQDIIQLIRRSENQIPQRDTVKKDNEHPSLGLNKVSDPQIQIIEDSFNTKPNTRSSKKRKTVGNQFNFHASNRGGELLVNPRIVKVGGASFEVELPPLNQAGIGPEYRSRRNSLSNLKEVLDSKALAHASDNKNQSEFKGEKNSAILKDLYAQLLRRFMLCVTCAHECIIDKAEDGSQTYQSSSPDEMAILTKMKEIGTEFMGVRNGVLKFDFFGTISHYRLELVFEFDSDRKRQSVIVHDGQDYVLFVKGADTSIIPFLDPNNVSLHKIDLELSLLKFSRLGYRTLVFAQRILTTQEFQEIKRSYSKILTSGNKKEASLADLACQIEIRLELLGATAVEDKLQEKVKETIVRLLDAKIKVWMITGDKLETAENIGMMSGILNQSMGTYYLRNVSPQNCYEKLHKLKNELLKRTFKTTGIIFDMRELGIS